MNILIDSNIYCVENIKISKKQPSDGRRSQGPWREESAGN